MIVYTDGKHWWVGEKGVATKAYEVIRESSGSTLVREVTRP